MTSITVNPSKGLQGTISVPGDKSISHRALIFGSLADGESRIGNLLLGEDVLSTMRIFQQMGIPMSHTPENLREGDVLTINGKGLHGLKKPSGVLDCGNSGTTLRLLMGLLAAQPFESVLTGDDSLNKRPVDRVIKPLSEMGAQFDVFLEKGKRFIKVIGNSKLKAIHYDLPVASAQLKSAILLAGLYADGEVTITEPYRSRDHTERFLDQLKVPISIEYLPFPASLLKLAKGNLIKIAPVESLKPFDIEIPGDFSSAAFFLIGALIVPNSEISLTSIGINPTRILLIDLLRNMGANIEINKRPESLTEPVADIVVRSSFLKNVWKIMPSTMPYIIDEIPIFTIAVARAEGTGEITHASELRVKESDRIHAMCQELEKLGVTVTEKEEGMEIKGKAGQLFNAGHFKSYGDHRVAMSMSIAALCADKPSVIEDIDYINTSFPGFYKVLKKLSI